MKCSLFSFPSHFALHVGTGPTANEKAVACLSDIISRWSSQSILIKMLRSHRISSMFSRNTLENAVLVVSFFKGLKTQLHTPSFWGQVWRKDTRKCTPYNAIGHGRGLKIQLHWLWPFWISLISLGPLMSAIWRRSVEIIWNHCFFRFSVSTFHLLVRVLLCPCKGAWCSGSSRTFAPCCAPYVLTKALQLLVLVHRHLALCPGMRWRCRNLKAFPLLFTDFLALHANVNLYSKYNLRWVFVAYREVLPPPMPDVLQYWKKAGLKLLNNLDEKVSTIFNFYPDTSWTWSFD